MGPYLSVPKKEKATVSGEGKNIIYAASEMQGKYFFLLLHQFQDGETQWKTHTLQSQI